MSLGLCVLVRDRQDSICVRFARAGLFVPDRLFCAGLPDRPDVAGCAGFCSFCFFWAFRSIMRVMRRGRGTRRACRTLQFDQGSDRCAWCLSMGANAPAVCTFKARGRQEMLNGRSLQTLGRTDFLCTSGANGRVVPGLAARWVAGCARWCQSLVLLLSVRQRALLR